MGEHDFYVGSIEAAYLLNDPAASDPSRPYISGQARAQIAAGLAEHAAATAGASSRPYVVPPLQSGAPLRGLLSGQVGAAPRVDRHLVDAVRLMIERAGLGDTASLVGIANSLAGAGVTPVDLDAAFRAVQRSVGGLIPPESGTGFVLPSGGSGRSVALGGYRGDGSGVAMINDTGSGGGPFSYFPGPRDLVSQDGERGEGQSLFSEHQSDEATVRDWRREQRERDSGPADPGVPPDMPHVPAYPDEPERVSEPGDWEPQPEGTDPVAEGGDPDSSGGSGSAAVGMALLRAVPALWWTFVHSTQHPASGHGGDPSRESDGTGTHGGADPRLSGLRRGWADEPSWGADPAVLAAAAARWDQLRAMFAHRGDPPRTAAARAAALTGARASTSGAAVRMSSLTGNLRSAGVAAQLNLGSATGSKIPSR